MNDKTKKKWVKIDRLVSTPHELEVRKEVELKRDLKSQFVWVQEVEEPRPVFDPNTEKLKKVYVLPDLSDLSKPVKPSVKRVVTYNVSPLNADEIKNKKIREIISTDKSMPRITENVITLLVEKGVIAWDELPVENQEIINKRRVNRRLNELSKGPR